MDDDTISLRLPKQGYGIITIRWFVEEYLYQKRKTTGNKCAYISEIYNMCRTFYSKMGKKEPEYISVWRIVKSLKRSGNLGSQSPDDEPTGGSKIPKTYVYLTDKRYLELGGSLVE